LGRVLPNRSLEDRRENISDDFLKVNFKFRIKESFKNSSLMKNFLSEIKKCYSPWRITISIRRGGLTISNKQNAERSEVPLQRDDNNVTLNFEPVTCNS
jgi:hypothetical protein